MRKPKVVLYDSRSIEDLEWPQTKDGQYAKHYMKPLIEKGPGSFIENVNTSLLVCRVDDLIFPITINETEYDNTYVCSFYTHYISYAKQELDRLESRFLRKTLTPLLSLLGFLLKMGRMNQVVQVNNWLVSTNLYPDITPEQAEALVSHLQARFPHHAIVFRSLHRSQHQELMDTLQYRRFRMLASRQIYWLHPSQKKISAKARWLLKRDYALIEKNGYEVVDGDALTEEDIPRIVELYHSLYIEKYSPHNPQFNARFIELALRDRILQIKAIRKQGRIDAVLGYFCRNGVMTTPLFGYDRSIPIQVGLYRMLSALLYQISLQNQHVLHESSGVGQFKRNRGAVGEVEYMAVYDRHLPLSRRLIWSLVQLVSNRVGVPLIQKYKL